MCSPYFCSNIISLPMVSYRPINYLILNMDFTDILILTIVVIFVKADVQLTPFIVVDDYRAHDCTQLLSCDRMETVGVVQGTPECVLKALQNGTDMFIYGEGDKSCHLCFRDFVGSGIAEVHSSQLVYTEG